MARFINPGRKVQQDSEFSGREVGLTHPDVPGFLRIGDNGDIEIVADEGLSIILSPSSRTITFMADHINILTKHGEGLRWNKLAFNEKATTFREPTFVEANENHLDIYRGFDDFLGDD